MVPEVDGLSERLLSEFGLRVTAICRVAGGNDAEAMVLRAALVDGTSVAVKLSRGGSPAGLYAAQLLAGLGVIGVPAPLLARSDMPFSTAGGLRLSVTPWLSGRSGASAPLSAEQWRSFGRLLARVHEAQVPSVVRAHLPVDEYDALVTARMRSLNAQLGTERWNDPLARTLVGRWLGTADVLMAIAEQVESLSVQLRARPVRAVLCHADAHTGNVLVGDDRRSGCSTGTLRYWPLVSAT